MTDGKLLVEKLLRYAKKFLHLSERDEIYFRNLLLREFKILEPLEVCPDLSYIDNLSVPDEIVKEVETYGKENGLFNEGEDNLYSTYIMGILSPLPSAVNGEFMRIKKEEGIEKACEYFYNLSILNNYVQKTAISKNLKWIYPDGDKYLEITINLSKPEKDNKEIAKLLTAPKKGKYPLCLLCKENEGFQGTLTHPARENIRTISLKLGGEDWFVQYSPYAYYEEHMIAISNNHSPMHIEKDTIEKLLDFVDFFPNYMIGSNAALPIIGGSILNHEHFQGGKHLMPMHHAKIKESYASNDYKKVKVGVVDWYNSVIRLESENRQEISKFASEIIDRWKDYTDEEVGIYSHSGDVKHNSLAPVCRKLDGKYIIDVILRNNRTSEEFPDGIFHAHPEYHNIKKEGIGLIEAMGLFILPGRLKKQLGMIAEILCGKVAYNKEELNNQDNYLYAHRNMIEELMRAGLAKDIEQAEKRVTDKVNEICKNILFNTAVFKNDEKGECAFKKFLNKINVK
ncbi:MAG: UDP-glucose--hexose-1-phosphate uridylyltransferase [Clostridia bacterium]|nr:UDP-glucose--hexose-1-phosphate uridylyltransferase [Clostridia bacterium]